MKPRVVVLSAPSGGGKTTIAQAVRDRYADRFGFSVSATTRKPRPGEREGEAYYFLTRDSFLEKRNRGDFLESAEYAGELYGTLKSEVERIRDAGRHVLLDIEVDGAAQVKQAEPEAITIFVLPSEPRVLVERLLKRGSESPAQIKARLDRAKYELGHATTFDRWIRNDDLNDAVREVVSVVDEGGRFHRAQPDLTWLADYGYRLQEHAQRVYDELHQTRG